MKTLTVAGIRKANPQGKMSMDFDSRKGGSLIVFDNGVTFSFGEQGHRARKNTWNKLKRMGYEQHYNTSSDELDGLAAANPKEVFNYSVISN